MTDLSSLSWACADCWLDWQSHSDSGSLNWFQSSLCVQGVCVCMCALGCLFFLCMSVCVCINEQSSHSSRFHFSAAWIMSLCMNLFDVPQYRTAVELRRSLFIVINQLNVINSLHQLSCTFCKTAHPTNMEIIKHVFEHILIWTVAKNFNLLYSYSCKGNGAVKLKMCIFYWIFNEESEFLWTVGC